MDIGTAERPDARAGRRPYRMGARAIATAHTRERILRSVLLLHTELFHDQITLEAIAARAGVTVPTVLRHFTSREGAVAAAAELARSEVWQQRSAAPVGDVQGAVSNVIEHYEQWGRSALRLLAQEERVPELKAIADRGRAAHYAWVEHAFGPYLTGADVRFLRARLIALTDVYVWKLLRLDQGLSRQETEGLVAEMVQSAVTKALADGRQG